VLAAGCCERFGCLHGVELFGCPWPCVLEVEVRASSGQREPGGDVQQSVADALIAARTGTVSS
jgi:hypothetical protein